MARHILCPVQTSETFQIENCLQCRYMEVDFGGPKGGHHPRCRKQKTPAQKREWKYAYMEYQIGEPLEQRTKVVVTKPEK